MTEEQESTIEAADNESSPSTTTADDQGAQHLANMLEFVEGLAKLYPENVGFDIGYRMACERIARYMKDRQALQPDERIRIDAAAYQVRRYCRSNTATPGWGEWETVERQKYDDICAYIEMGYLFYQARSLTCSHAVCHKLSPPDDCQGTQDEGIAKDFVGNPFDFRK